MFGRDSGVDLSLFVAGFVRALTNAQQALPKSRRELIRKHFKQDEATGIFWPRFSVFALNESQRIAVPNYCISRTNSMGIDSAVITCSARIVSVKKEEIDCEFSDEQNRVKFMVKPASPDQKNTFQITMNFSKREDIEAENQLYQALDGLVEVFTEEDPPEKSYT